MDIDWGTVLVAAIVPLIAFAGVIYNDIRKKRNARVDTESATALMREPTWVELETSNRELRAEMAKNKRENDERVRLLEERFDAFEQKTNRRIGALSNMLHSASRQWPSEHPGPYFEQEDLDALENTDVPYVWRNRVRPQRL